MVAIRLTALLILVGVAGSMAGETAGKATVSVTPIQKVITLMKDMVEKGIAEKQKEAEMFATFSQWCIDTKKVKSDEIAVSEETILKQTAVIQKAEVNIEQLSARISELDEDVGRWTKDKAAATEVRSKESADYTATVADYGESIDAIARAVVVLKERTADVPQALLQVQASQHTPLAVRSVLAAFLQQGQPNVDAMPDKELSYEAPEANSYEFQSGGVVEMLEKLGDEFKTKKYELEMEELKTQHAFEAMIQQLSDNIEIAENEISKKSTTRGKKMKLKATTEGDKAVTEDDLAEDEKYLADTTALCEVKTADFESRQKLRAEEIDTINKAIEIISSDAVAGAGEKYLPALVQTKARVGTALAQLRNGDRSPALRAKMTAFLTERAKISGSRMLAELEQHVAAGDPFTKVKKMIQELIWKLEEEATAETEDKGWCDTELSTNKMSRESKTATIEELTVQAEDLTAKIAKLTQDIEDLTAAIAAIDAAVAKETKERMESKAINEETIKDSKAAQVGIQQAMAVLKEFYAKSATATALAQQPAVDAPETFEKPYKGLLPEGGSVVDFLEVILTDMARLESETTAAEAKEAAEYKKFMFDSEKDRAMKANEKSHKESSKTDAEGELQQTNDDLKMTQSALDKANKYYETLQPKCVDSGITYEERVKRREEEMDSLEEALKILTGVDIA
mmetsp:Transcript_36603/g.68470  ORF Transcript_36603/g.68470 Transcript_36603/m.68470 type:complete len:686 (+) Transcript_36603:103-2160(+)